MTRTVKMSALILSILVVIAGLPMTVFGAKFSEWLESNASEVYSGSADVSLQKGVYELNELREENVKHFRQEDGSNVAVVYSDAVHYMDADGEWQDIDNTLSDDGNEYGTSNARIKFTKKTPGNGSIFTLHENNRKITLSLDGAIKKTLGSVRASESVLSEDATQLQKLMELSKLSSTISYADILDGVDLEYDVVSMNIKERIVVKEKLSSYDYSFTLALNNLSARLAEDGSVELYDTSTNDTAYVIPAPFMYDSAEEYSDAVYYTLTDLGNGKYKLLISADDEWINAENRTFPVTIDPAVYPATASGVTDTYINSYSKTLAPYNYKYLYVGNTTQFYWKTANMPTIPDSAYVTKATFTAKYIGGTAETSTYYFGAYQVTSAWDNTLTWNKYKASPASGAYVYANIVDYTTATLTAGTPSQYFYTWDVTEIVRNWEKGDTDYGICISDIPGYTTKNTKFASSEYTTVAHRPKLLIEYRDMKGVEDYWSYTAQNIGNAGTGYVNNATGNLTLAISTLATTDALFGYAPTLVYNSSIAHKEYTSANATVPYTQAHAGFGFKLSTQESIVQRNYSYENDTTRTYYIWADSDGTEHAFYPDDNNAELFYDEDGLGLKLTVDSTANTVTITDRSYNQKIFTAYNGGWVMSSIRDTSGNELIFTLDANARVTKISVKPNGLSAIDFLTLTYNSSGVISRIENASAKRAVTFLYSSIYNGSASASNSGYLRQVNYVHFDTSDTIDCSVYYTYDSSGRLLSAKDGLSQYKVSYTYDSGKVISITEYGGSSDTAGQTIGITYNGDVTVIRGSGTNDIYGDSDDILTKYAFDYAGRTVSAYSTDLSGTIVYGASSGEYVKDNELAENHIKMSSVVSDATANYITNGGFELYDDTADLPTYWNAYIPYESSLSKRENESKFGSYEVGISASGEEPVELYQQVFLKAGEYTLSADLSALNPELAYVELEVVDTYATFYTQKCSFDRSNASEDQLFASLTFDVTDLDNGGDVVTVIIRVSPTVGSSTVYVDNVTLQEGNGVGKFSYVNYGSFEQSLSDYSPSEFWSMTDSSTLTCETVTSEFDQSLKITGDLASAKSAKQRVTFSHLNAVTQPTFLRLSGFAKAESSMYNEESEFRLRAIINYSDGTSSAINNTADFNKTVTDWQFVNIGIPVESGKTISSVDIFCDYDYNFGNAYFDDIKLVAVDDHTVSGYTYDEITGLPDAYITGMGSTFYKYYDKNNYYDADALDGLLKLTVTSGTNKLVYYNYNSTTRNVTSQDIYTLTTPLDIKATPADVQSEVYDHIPFDEMGMMTDQGYFSYYGETTYTYNTYGLITQTISTRVGYSYPSVSTASYNLAANSKIFGSVSEQTDSSGYVTKYFYDSSNGHLLAAVSGKSGESTYDYGYAYTYDAMGRTTQVVPASCTSTATSATADNFSAKAIYSYNSQSRLSSVQTTSTTYNFTYDVFGNADTIGVGSVNLVDYAYNSKNGKLLYETYANNFSVKYTYDPLDRIEKIWYNDDVSTDNSAYYIAYTYTYDTNGNIAKLTDHINNEETAFKYDTSGRPVYSCKYNLYNLDGSAYANKYSIQVAYDDKSRISVAVYSIDYPSASAYTENLQVGYHFAYDEENRLSFSYAEIIPSSMLPAYNEDEPIYMQYYTAYSYDKFNRLSGTNLSVTIDGYTPNLSVSTNYTYEVSNGQATSRVATYSTNIGGTATGYSYSYDAKGNITEIRNNSTSALIASFTYDNLNRLTRENNAQLGKTYTYTYDNAGNITNKKTYAYTTGTLGSVQSTKTYTYGNSNWGDQLTAYNYASITYDASGNPLNYYNDFVFTWTQGRRLQMASRENHPDLPDVSLSFTYNESGIRTTKTVGSVVHEYILDGTKIVAEKWGVNGVTHLVEYIYDANSVIGMIYHNTTMSVDSFEQYVFEKNLQGDIVAVYNASGTLCVKYTYDAWGNVTTTYYNGGASTAAQYNGFRYRGYYYDSETGLYYLNSRYYDPAIGRFINADTFINANGDLTGFNMYAYCSNNPVMYKDPSGHLIEKGIEGADAWQPYTLNQIEYIKSFSKHGIEEGARVLNKKIQNECSKYGLSESDYEERLLWGAETKLPWQLYDTYYYTTLDNPIDVFSSALISGYLGDMDNSNLGAAATYAGHSAVNNLLSDIEYDILVYARNSSDLAKAITITTCFDTLDLVVGIATMPIDAFTPSVGATISTTFYYFKQGLKIALIGY